VGSVTDCLVTDGLTRSFRGRRVVDDVALRVEEGVVYGFLGPNGAGKTTAIRCILGLIRPDRGEVSILGERDPVRRRRHVGAIVETPAFHDGLTGRENLKLARAYAGLHGADIDWALDRVGLLARGEDRVRTYSLGMRQRLGIARALLGKPRLLVLDEPTNGLDPRGMHDVRVLLRQLCDEERISVFVSSHLLAEVEQLCTRVGILEKGTLVAQGRVQDLIRGLASRSEVDVQARDPMGLRATLAAIPGAEAGEAGDDGAVRVRLDGLDVPGLNRALVAAGVEVLALIPVQGSLEDLFLRFTTRDIT
jgi:ABC-2 type transport system ATP-binding protein